MTESESEVEMPLFSGKINGSEQGLLPLDGPYTAGSGANHV